MFFELVKEFTFEANRGSTEGSTDHPCARKHRHSYRVAVKVEADLDLRSQTGSVLDYDDIESAMKPLLDQHLNHTDLDKIEGLEKPASENLPNWIYIRLKKRLPGLKEVTLFETCLGACSTLGTKHRAKSTELRA